METCGVACGEEQILGAALGFAWERIGTRGLVGEDEMVKGKAVPRGVRSMQLQSLEEAQRVVGLLNQTAQEAVMVYGLGEEGLQTSACADLE